MGGNVATVQLRSVRYYYAKEAWGPGANLTPQPVKLCMMQPKERVVGREAYCQTVAILLRQGLRAGSGQISAHEVVYVVVHSSHCVLEAEEVTSGLLSRIAHKLRAESAVLGQLVGEPAGDERQVSPQGVRNGPGKLQAAGRRGKSAGGDCTVGLGGGITVPCSAQPVLERVLKHWRVKQVRMITRPIPVWRWSAVPTGLAEGSIE